MRAPRRPAARPRSERERASAPALPRRNRVGPLAGLVVIAAVIATMTVVDRRVGRPVIHQRIALTSAGAVATADDAGSSTWICAGGEGEEGATIDLSNPTDSAASGTIRFLGPLGTLGEREVTLAAGASTSIEFASVDITLPIVPGEIGPGEGVAAVVEFAHGGIVASHRLAPTTGSVTPCASSASTRWYLGDGATTRDATTTLVLVNPFTDDAVVDMSFATDSGAARPTPLQGFVVPKGTVRTIDVGSFVRRRSTIAAMVNARTGRVVAEGVLRFDGSGGTLGATVVQAAPATGSAWYFPSGKSSSALTERYLIFNPGTRDTVVELTVLVSGQDGEPFEIDVPAGQLVEFAPADETRVPKGVDYSMVAVSPQDRRVVVARRLEAHSRVRLGVASALGGRIVANRWTVSDARANGTVDDRVAVLNPSDGVAAVSVYRIVAGEDDPWQPVEGLQGLVLGGGDRLDIRLGDFSRFDGESVVVVSDGAPVFVDRSRVRVRESGDRPMRPDLSTPTGRGMSAAAGIASVAVAVTTTVGAAAETPTTLLGAAAPTTRVAGVRSSTTTSTTTAGTRPASSTSASTVTASTVTAVTPTSPLTASSTTAVSTTSAPTTSAPATPAPTTSAPTNADSTVTSAATSGDATTATAPTTSVAAGAAEPSGDLAVAVARVGRARVGTSTALAVPSIS